MGLYRESVTYPCLDGNEGIEASMGSIILGGWGLYRDYCKHEVSRTWGVLVGGPLFKVYRIQGA